MRATALALVCLACASDGRRVFAYQRYQGNPSAERRVSAKGTLASSQALANLLAAFDPACAFSFSGVGSSTRRLALPNSRCGQRMPAPLMADEGGEETFAIKQEEFQDPTELKFRKYAVFYGRAIVGLGPGFQPLVEDFAPSWEDDTSALSTAKVQFPVGMKFQESGNFKGRFEVIEVAEGSNAEKAGLMAGDLIRGVTAVTENRRVMQQNVEKDVAFSLSGGTTGPNIDLGRQRALFVADGQSFDAFVTALISNKAEKGGPEEAVFIIERNNPDYVNVKDSGTVEPRGSV